MAAVTAEDPAVGRDAEGIDVLTKDGDQLSGNGHLPCLGDGTVLEPPLIVR
jgi:hypothetical protein